MNLFGIQCIHFLVLLVHFSQASSIGSSEQTGFYVREAAQRPFLALKDTIHASSTDIQQFNEQGLNLAVIAYPLFGAAEPLSQALGSSNALLPYLTPIILRLYTSRPQRATSALFKQLYEVSWSLLGPPPIPKACHYDLYIALRETFTWVRDNIALQLQEVSGQPQASAMWPDMAKYPAQRLAAAVADALANPAKLGKTAMLVSGSCGLAVGDFAALIPNISVALKKLHADLPLLQDVGNKIYEAHYEAEQSNGNSLNNMLSSRRHVLATTSSSKPAALDVITTDDDERLLHSSILRADSMKDIDAKQQTDDASSSDDLRSRGRLLLTTTDSVYSMPPSTFTPAAPATMPALLMPLVFHIMLYQDSNGTIGPSQYDQAPAFIDRMIRQLNLISKPTNVQFFVKEIRNDASTYPLLLLSSRSSWLDFAFCSSTGCLRDRETTSPLVSDWPRSINIFVASESYMVSDVLGYAFVPTSDVYPDYGFVFVTWDCVSTSGYNSDILYNYGAVVLMHEIFHHLGLRHTFGSSSVYSCNNDDYVIDTPVTNGTVSSSVFSSAVKYCLDIFWVKYGGDWNVAYQRMASGLGIPETDMNAWADSCPGNPGYDELGNYMTYNTAVCFAALGHFTEGQAQRAHYFTAEVNPILYAWGQYYAATAVPPPPQSSPPPSPWIDICQVSSNGCPCKSNWTLGIKHFSGCNSIYTNTDRLGCEVVRSSCPSCSRYNSSQQCIQTCDWTATPQRCNVSQRTGLKLPPPLRPNTPRPPSPPPAPPPPPPRSVPEACKVAANGCTCRSIWYQGGKGPGSYCSSLNGSSNLWCQVTPTCTDYASNPYQQCASSLTASQCRSSNGYNSLAFKGNLTINYTCWVLENSDTSVILLVGALESELVRIFNVSRRSVIITDLACESTTSYTAAMYVTNFLVAGDSDPKVAYATNASNHLKDLISSSFTSKWGSVVSSGQVQDIAPPVGAPPVDAPRVNEPTANAPPVGAAAVDNGASRSQSKGGGLSVPAIVGMSVAGVVVVLAVITAIVVTKIHIRKLKARQAVAPSSGTVQSGSTPFRTNQVAPIPP
ncbi:hypothetical protein Vafri_5600 [Volvox africanus]|uniref:Peptidase M43 pregnancy-associated plasma-A domain-containing protein n=1 Tax=Volvox africanus TaxID=51714 RepID=A0A8J4EVV3_9CHLO|nr:hypothetical protein Vafri_5600 [Volvox africanus]